MSFSWYELGTYVLLTGLTIVLLKRILGRTANKQRVLPHCLPWLPYVGSLPFLGDPGKLDNFFLEESKKRGNVIAFYAGRRYAVVLNGFSTIHEAFVKKGEQFAGRQPFYVEENYSGYRHKGIINGPHSEEYTKFRQDTLVILKELGYGRSVAETRIIIEMEYFIEAIRKFNSRPFNPVPLTFHCTIGIVTGFMFGCHLDSTDPLIQHVKAFNDTWNLALKPEIDLLPVVRFLPKYATLLRTFNTDNRRLIESIRSKVKQCIEAGENCFVNSYVEKFGPDYEEDQLLYTLRDFLIAGSDTVVTQLAWILTYMANYTDLQQRLQREIDELLMNRVPSLEDMHKLPLVEATILEVMRLHTLVPFSIPRHTTCDTEVNGFFIPKNTMVLPNLSSAHMDPAEWKDPLEFRPDRFISEDGKVVGKERVIPFSLGKRSCIGELLARQELFFMVTRLLQLFDIRPPEGQSRVDVTPMMTLVVCPSPYTIRMIHRA